MTVLEIGDFIANVATAVSFWFLIAQLKNNEKQTKISNEQLQIYLKQSEIAEKDLNFRLEYQKREKSAEMAKLFSELLKDIVFLLNVIKLMPSTNQLNDKNYNELKKFNLDECKEYFKIEIAKIPYEIINVPLKDLLSKYESSYGRNSSELFEKYSFLERNNFVPYKSKTEISQEKKEYNKEYEKVLYRIANIFESKKTNCLNVLEYIAMNFCGKIADEDLVYPVIHQVYLEFVKRSYFYIVSNNSGEDRFYTYTINLYNRWSKKHSEKREEEKQMKLDLEKMHEPKISDLC